MQRCVLLPDPREILAGRQRLVLAELGVPLFDPVLVQAVAELDAMAEEPLLERHLEADALLAQLQEEVPDAP